MLDEKRKRLVNMISTLANLLVLSNFLMFRFASAPNRWTLSLTIMTWTIFIAAIITVNTWLYFSYYTPKGLDSRNYSPAVSRDPKNLA